MTLVIDSSIIYTVTKWINCVEIYILKKKVILLEQATFELKRNGTGQVYFVFKNDQGKMIAVSQSFSDRIPLEFCIAHIRNSIKLSKVVEEDSKQYAFLDAVTMNFDFPLLIVVGKNNAGRYYFYLLDFKDQLLMSSEDYDNHNACLNNLHYFRENAQTAKLMDLIEN